MKQVRFEAFGVPSQVARCVEVEEVGAPSAWEVVVEIEACAINPADIARLAGQYGELPRLPATLGMEAAGRIVARGASVDTLAVGDRVVMVGNDNWCQRRRVAAATVFKAPPGLDALQLATVKVNPSTALMLLRQQVPLARGDWVLQTAPLSSVGRAVLRIARHDGLRTINVVRRPEAVDEVKALGGDIALVDGPGLPQAVLQATRGTLPALALDAVGGEGVERVADCLAPHGQVVHYGMLSRQPIRLRSDQSIFKGIALKGFWLSRQMSRMPQASRDALLGDVVGLLAGGVLHTPIAATYAIDEIGAALRHAEQAARAGKVLILPNGPVDRTGLPGP